jgi:hypothetical protein
MRTGRRSGRAEVGTVTVPIEAGPGMARALFASSHDSIRVGGPASFGFSSAGRGGIVGT